MGFNRERAINALRETGSVEAAMDYLANLPEAQFGIGSIAEEDVIMSQHLVQLSSDDSEGEKEYKREKIARVYKCSEAEFKEKVAQLTSLVFDWLLEKYEGAADEHYIQFLKKFVVESFSREKDQAAKKRIQARLTKRYQQELKLLIDEKDD